MLSINMDSPDLCKDVIKNVCFKFVVFWSVNLSIDFLTVPGGRIIPFLMYRRFLMPLQKT